MLTLFSVPKPFEGHIGVIQRNALGSWVRLPEVEIILVGDEPGAAEAATEVGATHVRTVDRNEYGTPLLDSVFRQVREISKQPRLVYANADVMLFPDLVDAVRRIGFGELPAGWAFNATHLLTKLGVWPALAPVYLRARWRMRRHVDGRLERLLSLAQPAVILTRPIRTRFRRARLARTRRRPA
jgi:hypothetical protein